MSVNIDLNTSIRVPLELVAAIKAAPDGDVSSIVGMEQVTSAVNAAVVDAVRALPYEIRASQPQPAPTTLEKLWANAALNKTAASSRSVALPTNLILFKIKVRREYGAVFDVNVGPLTTVYELKHHICWRTGISVTEQILCYQGNKIGADTVQGLGEVEREDKTTMQKLGFKGGEVIDVFTCD